VIQIVVVEAARSIGWWRIDVHIAKVIVHYVDGIVWGWADGALINSVIETAGFQFGEDFGEEAGLGVDSQHARAEAIEEEQAPVTRERM
jgi:hypothetical protein